MKGSHQEGSRTSVTAVENGDPDFKHYLEVSLEDL